MAHKKVQIILIIIYLLFISGNIFPQTDKWQDVSNVFRRSGILKDNVYKIGFPRADLSVTIDGMKISAGLALGGWVAFMDMGNSSMVMGDLVVLESELPDVQKALVTGGIKITGIHNHLINETPKIMYMHIYGTGDKINLAGSIINALQKTATILDTNQLPKSTIPQTDWSKVESTLGVTGSKNGNLLNTSIARGEDITEDGMIIPSFMGVAHSINFQMINDKAFATGDFVLLPEEVDGVMNTLVNGGITVTALHNHMLFETPKLFFMHFWGYDSPDKLAKVLKSALDKTNYKKD